MTTPNQSNIIARFFQGLIKLATDLNGLLPGNKEKERAVRVWDIMNAVQKQLDAAGTVNDFGEVESSGYVLDTYIDDAGTFAIFTRSDGKLYKLPVFVDAQSQITTGPEVEVFMEFTPVSRSIQIQRQANGDVRWYAMPACTAFLNRSGEIDSRALFDSFVEYAERTNDFPELDFYHLGERLVFGKADMLFRDDVNFCASGLFDDTDIARAAIKGIEANGDYWGLSIAYLPTKEPEVIRSKEDIEIPVFNDGICRFISLLPEDTAASILTSISTQEEVNRMNQKQKDALKQLIGEDSKLFDQMVEQLEQNNRTASEPGVIVRENQTPAVAKAKAAAPAAVPAKTPAPAAKPSTVSREYTEEDIEKILGSDLFKSKIGEMFTEMRKAESATEEEVETVEEPTAAASEDRSLKDMLTELLEKMDGVSKSREAEVQEVLDDLPAKIVRAKIVRPRGTSNFTPSALVTEERRKLSLADIAAQTLENIGAAE